MLRHYLIFAVVGCLTLATINARSQTPTPKPVAVNLQVAQVPQGSMQVLKSTKYEEAIRGLGAVKRLKASDIRSRPELVLSNTKINFRPVLDNPAALPNVAVRLKKMPNLVSISSDELEAVEIDQGVVMRSVLTYSLKPGACREEQNRRQLSQAGVSCFRKMDRRGRETAFSNPKDPRYVADPRARAKAIADSNAQLAKDEAQQREDVAALRARFANASQRAELVQSLGAEEVARLEKMDDEALAGELVNTGETMVEQLAFMPLMKSMKLNQAKYFLNPAALKLAPVADKEKTYATERFVFLTGFTLGNNYEWGQRIEKTINVCLIACKRTYYAEVKAGFFYGLGLRFPIEFSGKYTSKTVNGKTTASFTPTFTPINGKEADYRDAGLENGKIFRGKELVAELGAWAELGANLPVYGEHRIRFEVSKDFTEDLPGDFKDGQFTPPDPVKGGGPKLEKVFYEIDLLGARGNFGAFGAQLYPAIRTELVSTKLEFGLTDLVAGGGAKQMVSGQEMTLAVDANDKSASRFKVGDPKYSLAFEITPGVVARMFIDLSVWGNDWEWPIWFPELGLTIPSGGVEFGCHKGTVCSREFRFTPAGEKSAFLAQVDRFVADYKAEWFPKCKNDKTCKDGIVFTLWPVVANAYDLDRAHKDGGPQPTLLSMSKRVSFARGEAAGIVAETEVRRTQHAWATLLLEVYTKSCKDKQCYDEVSALSKQYIARSKALMKQHPEESQTTITGMANKEFGVKFQAAVSASKKRAEGESRPFPEPGVY